MRRLCFVIAFCLIYVGFARQAQADTTDEVSFTVTVNSSGTGGGPLAGDVFTGTYTYDATELASLGPGGFVPLLSFTFTYPPWSGQTLSSVGLDSAIAFASGGIDVFYAPPPDGNTAAFDIPTTEFDYGMTVLTNSIEVAGSGAISYSAPVPLPTSTPEPGSLLLLGSGLIGMAARTMRKRRSG